MCYTVLYSDGKHSPQGRLCSSLYNAFFTRWLRAMCSPRFVAGLHSRTVLYPKGTDNLKWFQPFFPLARTANRCTKLNLLGGAPATKPATLNQSRAETTGVLQEETREAIGVWVVSLPLGPSSIIIVRAQGLLALLAFLGWL